MRTSDLANDNDKMNNENNADNASSSSNKKKYIIIGSIVAAVIIIAVVVVIVVLVTKDDDSSSSNESNNVEEYINNYQLSNAKFTDDKKNKFTADLKFEGSYSPSGFKDVKFQNPNSLTPIKELSILIELQCDEMIHIKITDKNNKRWESPYSISDTYQSKISSCSNTKSLSDVGFNIETDSEKLVYSLIKDNVKILTNEDSRFFFSDNFIMFGEYLSNHFIAGFGERFHDFKLNDGIYTSWPNDTGGIHEDVENGGHNLMGLQPIGLHKTKDNKFLGILFNNINAQDTYIKTIESEKILLEHRTIGGVIDYYLYYDEDPDKVLIKLHDIVGQPQMPPFWSFGFHQCRYGYNNTQEIREVYNNYTSRNLPIDTFWGDIDILDHFRIFSLNKTTFADLPALVDTMHTEHFHFIPIVDLGFKIDENDEYYKLGHEKNAFLISNYTKQELIAIVWPGEAVFPDFFNPEMPPIWDKAMRDYQDIIKYDGIWIDMNEPAQLLVREDTRCEILPEGYDYDVDKNMYEYIPYMPGYREKERVDLRSHSLSENAISIKYNDDPLYTSYNFKALMALMQAEYTKKSLENLNKRSFVLTRSTTLGTGRYGFHWLGDNFAQFRHMRNGVTGIFNFNIFGIPMTGDDICGFIDNTWDDLCARWMALGTLFPFSRNHRDIKSRNQEPYAFGDNSNTLKISQIALPLRYSLLRYFYSNMYLISLGEKGSFFKPVFFNYINDNKTYDKIDYVAMIGDSFILFPLFQNETTDIDGYFPNDDWYYINGKSLLKKKSSGNEGTTLKLSGAFDIIHLYLRGGSIIPYQDTSTYVKNTYELQQKPLEIIITPDSIEHKASGTFIFDNDGIDDLKNKDYNRFELSFNDNILTVNHVNNMTSTYNSKDDIISKVKIYGAEYLNTKTTLKVDTNDNNSYDISINISDDNVLTADLSTNSLKLENIKTMTLS